MTKDRTAYLTRWVESAALANHLADMHLTNGNPKRAELLHAIAKRILNYVTK